MEKEKEYKLIEEGTLSRLIVNNMQQGYAISILSCVCYRHKIDIALTLTEACRILDLSPQQLQLAVKHCLIRPIGEGGTKFFSAFDLVVLAAKIRRKQVAAQIHKMPSYVIHKEKE